MNYNHHNKIFRAATHIIVKDPAQFRNHKHGHFIPEKVIIQNQLQKNHPVLLVISHIKLVHTLQLNQFNTISNGTCKNSVIQKSISFNQSPYKHLSIYYCCLD